MTMWAVRFVGNFGTMLTSAEADAEEEAVTAARQEFIDWHGIDPTKHGFDEVSAEAEEEPVPSRCEDFPCCGHEAGDCNGGLYGSDESIKARIYNMSAEQFDDYLDRPDGY